MINSARAGTTPERSCTVQFSNSPPARFGAASQRCAARVVWHGRRVRPSSLLPLMTRGNGAPRGASSVIRASAKRGHPLAKGCAPRGAPLRRFPAPGRALPAVRCRPASGALSAAPARWPLLRASGRLERPAVSQLLAGTRSGPGREPRRRPGVPADEAGTRGHRIHPRLMRLMKRPRKGRTNGILSQGIYTCQAARRMSRAKKDRLAAAFAIATPVLARHVRQAAGGCRLSGSCCRRRGPEPDNQGRPLPRPSYPRAMSARSERYSRSSARWTRSCRPP